MEGLNGDLRRITGLYLKAPTMPLFNRTRALRDQAFGLLAGRQRPAQARELYAVAGWALTVLAWMTVDLGRPDVAESHARTARACADNADHNGLKAWVCATQHTAAFWQDDYERAAQYAAEGRQYATGSAGMFLASAHALDLARIGDAGAGREALAAAKHAAETDPVGGDDMLGPLHCTPARTAGFWADAHLAFGDARPALAISENAMHAFEQIPEPQRNHGSERMVRLMVAKAHLKLGEPGGAAEALAPVLQAAPEHRVRPLLRSIREVQELAAPQARKPAAISTGIRDDITEFVKHPAAEVESDDWRRGWQTGRSFTRLNRWSQHQPVGATVAARPGPRPGSSSRAPCAVCC